MPLSWLNENELIKIVGGSHIKNAYGQDEIHPQQASKEELI